MNTLLKNILWRLRYFLIAAAIVLVLVVFVALQRQSSQRALQAEATRKIEREKLQQVESNRVVQLKAEEARQQLEENNRLVKIQEVERQKQAEKQAKEKRAAELKAYKARYLGNQNTRYSIAILVANETGQPNAPLGHALGTLLNTNGLTTTASLFTPEFIADGLFDKTIAGAKEIFDKLELTNFVQAVLLAHQSVQYSTNSALDGLITATMTVEVNAFSTSAFQLLFADNIKVAGAGLSRLEARAMAEERVLTQFKDGRLGSVQKAVLTEGK